jgi:hypothetical protein
MGEQSAVRFLRTDDTNSVQGLWMYPCRLPASELVKPKPSGPVEAFLPAIVWRASQCGWVRIGKTEHGHDVSARIITTTTNSSKVEKDPSF